MFKATSAWTAAAISWAIIASRWAIIASPWAIIAISWAILALISFLSTSACTATISAAFTPSAVVALDTSVAKFVVNVKSAASLAVLFAATSVWTAASFAAVTIASFQLANPSASEVNILPNPCVPSTIFTVPATSKLAVGVIPPIPNLFWIRTSTVCMLVTNSFNSMCSIPVLSKNSTRPKPSLLIILSPLK